VQKNGTSLSLIKAISAFDQLQMLDLSSNRIKYLMPSKSEKQYANQLSTVVSLNLSDNPFKSIQETTDQVQALMPNITDLQISLFDEMDVDYIIS
jgi:Leucine-rich repeat (LRR) protein